MTARSLAVQNGNGGKGDLFVLSGGDPTDSDGSDSLAFEDNRHSSLHRYDSFHCEKGGLPAGNRIFHGFRWPFEKRGSSGFALRDGDASGLRFIELLKHD